MAEVLGHISQIIGPVVDVHFEHSEKEQNANLPSIRRSENPTSGRQDIDRGSAATHRRRHGAHHRHG